MFIFWQENHNNQIVEINLQIQCEYKIRILVSFVIMEKFCGKISTCIKHIPSDHHVIIIF